MAIEGLQVGLELAGHSVHVQGSGAGGGLLPTGSLPRRLGYNLAVAGRMDPGSWDLLVGFDLDGFLLPSGGDTPKIVCIKGVAADELRFESGRARLQLRVLSLLESANARRADRVVVPSRYSRRQVSASYGIPRERIRVVPEGIHVHEWSSQRPADDPGASPIVLSVARQYRRKNTRDLLLAFRQLLRHRSARLRVVGGGPELPALRRLCGRLGLGRHVTFLGAVAETAALRAEYARADLFCLPTLQEGFGIAFLEAMASGLPVVACRAGAVPEVVPDGEAGLLCPPGHPEALAGAMQALMDEPARREAMGEVGRRRARRYDWADVAARFLAVARELGPGGPEAAAPDGDPGPDHGEGEGRTLPDEGQTEVGSTRRS